MKYIVFLVLLGYFMTGCGGSSSTSSVQTLSLQKGYVLDSPISGLDYECGDIVGVTDDEGMFECRKFPVTFKIGNLTIGTISKMPADKKVYPQDIIGKKRTNFTDAKVIELTRFLQSLDDDGNIDKIIKITPTIKKSFTTKQTLSTLSEDSQKALVEDAGKSYVSKEAAMTHLKENVEKLTSIKITPNNMTIELGKQAILNAQGSYSNGAKKDITSEVIWSSSKPTIATINGTKAEAKSIGTTTLTATYKGISKTVTLTVTEASLISLDINATDTEIAEGTETKLSVKGTFADATTTIMTSQVTWSSSDTTKATVDATGTVRALVTGIVTITAQKGSITATKTIMISDAELTAIEITPETQSIAKGLTTQITVTGSYTNGQTQTLTSGVDFNSSDENVATVDASGKVTASKYGTVTIGAKAGLFITQITVNVTPAILSSIKINPLEVANIAKGKTVQLTVTGTYSDKTTEDVSSQVIWSSITPSLATVSSGGLLTTIGLGTAKIKAIVGILSNETSIVVSDAELIRLSVTIDKQDIAKGLTSQMQVTGTYSDDSTIDVTSQISWKSSDINIAEINNSGMITAKNVGVTTIIAKIGSITTLQNITVLDAVLQSLKLAPSSVTSLAKGTTTQLSATGTYSDTTTKNLTTNVMWSSNNNTIATANTLVKSQLYPQEARKSQRL